MFGVILNYITNTDNNLIINHDILAHSLGGCHAAMYINEIYKHQNYSKHNVILCDPTCNVIDFIITHIYPFVNAPTTSTTE